MRLYAVNPGFDLEHVLSLQAPNFAQQTPERLRQFNNDVIERVKAEASVKNAAMASAAPLAGSFPQQREFRIDGADADAISSGPRTVSRVVSSSYFETIGTPLKAGRSFQPTDTRHVAARRDSQRVDGEVLLQDRQRDRPAHQLEADQRHHRRRVVDAAGGDRRRRRRLPRRRDRPGADAHDVSGRHADRSRRRRCSSAPPARPTASRRTSSRRFGSSIRIGRSITCRRSRKSVTRRSRRSGSTRRSSACSPALALAIATVGVAGVLAFSVSQRTNELGIRVALGAERGTILRMILGEGAAMALARSRRRRRGRRAAVAAAERAALRHRAGGPADDRDGGGAAPRRRARRRVGTRAARDGRRSDDRATRRMRVARSQGGYARHT